LLRIVACASALLWAADPAAAHLMPAQQGTVHLKGEVAYVVLSLPVSAIGGDDDGDEGLSVPELQRHGEALRARVRDGFRLYDGEARAQAAMLQLVTDDYLPAGPDRRHVVLLAQYRFAGPPAHVRVETDLFGARDDERRLTLRARTGTHTESVVLTPRHASRALFEPPWHALVSGVFPRVSQALGAHEAALLLTAMLLAAAGVVLLRRRAQGAARAGQSTEPIATMISATAAQSCQCSTSPSHSAPVNTPSTGIIMTESVDATGGSERAR
jgi:hypothetical protein